MGAARKTIRADELIEIVLDMVRHEREMIAESGYSLKDENLALLAMVKAGFSPNEIEEGFASHFGNVKS